MLGSEDYQIIFFFQFVYFSLHSELPFSNVRLSVGYSNNEEQVW